MSIVESIILGIIQGLTEFLPISSTGHLTLAGKLMGVINPTNPKEWTSFMAVIQLGTMVAVVIYFWKDLFAILQNFLKDNLTQRKKIKEQSRESKLGWFIIVGTIPVVIIGLLFKDIIEGVLTKNLYVISGSLILLAIILWIAEKVGKFDRTEEKLSWKDSIIVGLAQALSLIPGSSRSGTTITAGLFLGLTRETAARFSFLLSIPAVFASGMLQFYQALEFITPDSLLTLSIATIISGVSGYLAIEFLLRFLKKNTTFVFILYRIVIGIIIIALLNLGIILP
ncbi:UDP-diphosphatase [bacterium BRH_c32]|nr:MAG: UDP-diphosphatase [bacterium BRH_c32]